METPNKEMNTNTIEFIIRQLYALQKFAIAAKCPIKIKIEPDFSGDTYNTKEKQKFNETVDSINYWIDGFHSSKF